MPADKEFAFPSGRSVKENAGTCHFAVACLAIGTVQLPRLGHDSSPFSKITGCCGEI
jgi:hypothetical protein